MMADRPDNINRVHPISSGLRNVFCWGGVGADRGIGGIDPNNPNAGMPETITRAAPPLAGKTGMGDSSIEERSTEEQRREEMREFIRCHWHPGIDLTKFTHLEDYVREEYEKLDAAFAALPREQQEERVRQIAKRMWYPNIHADHYLYAPLRREFEKLSAEHNRKYMILAPPNQQKASGRN
jgi:hypothetical protein